MSALESDVPGERIQHWNISRALWLYARRTMCAIREMAFWSASAEKCTSVLPAVTVRHDLSRRPEEVGEESSASAGRRVPAARQLLSGAASLPAALRCGVRRLTRRCYSRAYCLSQWWSLAASSGCCCQRAGFRDRCPADSLWLHSTQGFVCC